MSVAHVRGDRGRDGAWVLVLPGPNDGPACLCKPLVGVAVTPPVALDFLGPPVAVVARPVAVPWTAVPEAAVDEHGDTQPWEHEVGASAEPWQGRSVNEVAQTEGVHRPADRELRRGVALGNPRHAGGDAAAGRR